MVTVPAPNIMFEMVFRVPIEPSRTVGQYKLRPTTMYLIQCCVAPVCRKYPNPTEHGGVRHLDREDDRSSGPSCSVQLQDLKAQESA